VEELRRLHHHHHHHLANKLMPTINAGHTIAVPMLWKIAWLQSHHVNANLAVNVRLNHVFVPPIPVVVLSPVKARVSANVVYRQKKITFVIIL
jgi:hypothetical protein